MLQSCSEINAHFLEKKSIKIKVNFFMWIHNGDVTPIRKVLKVINGWSRWNPLGSIAVITEVNISCYYFGWKCFYLHSKLESECTLVHNKIDGKASQLTFKGYSPVKWICSMKEKMYASWELRQAIVPVVWNNSVPDRLARGLLHWPQKRWSSYENVKIKSSDTTSPQGLPLAKAHYLSAKCYCIA